MRARAIGQFQCDAIGIFAEAGGLGIEGDAVRVE